MVALRILVAFTGLFAAIQVWCIGLSLLGVGMTQPLAVLGLALALVGATALAFRFGHGDEVQELASRPCAPAGEGSKGGRARSIVALATGAAYLWLGWIWVRLLHLAWEREPLGWDALWYHIPAIHEWVLRGQVAFLPLGSGLESAPLEVLTAGWVNFPMGVELTAFFTYYLLGSDRLLDATNLWYWPLAVSSLVVLAGRLGARGAWSWLAGALLFGAALFAAQSASLYIDPGFGSAVLAALAAGVVLLFPVTGERPLLKAVLFGLALGLVLGGKGPGLPYAGALGMLVAAVVLWRARFDRLRRPLLRIAVAFCVMTAVGGYWSIRNAVHTGNPLYPIQVKIGHKVLAHGYDLTGYAELDWVVRPSLKSYPPWARLVVSWTQPDSPLLNETRAIEYAGVGGLGFLWLLGALPAVLYLWGLAVVRRDRELVHVLGFLTAASLALLALTTIKWQGRYTYWMYGLGLPAMVVVLQDAMRSSVRRRWHLATLGLGLGAICVAAWESAGTVALEIRRGAVVDSTGALAYRSTVDNLWPGLARSPGFRELLGDRHVARGPWSEGGATRFGGVLALPLGQRRVDVLPPDPSDEQLDALMEVGVRWVLWTETDPDRIPIALTSRASESFVWGRGKNRYYVFNLGDCLEVPGALEP